MSVSKLFESLDEKVFTSDLKEALEAQFNEAVELKASIMAEARIEEEIDKLNEKSELHIELLTEKSEQYINEKETEMLNSLDKYLDRVVEEFVNESSESLDESIKSEKADMIIEAFDSMLIATGVNVAKIVESKDESSVELKLKESIEKYDALIEENISLKEETDKLLKMGVIAELKEGLSIVESEKFEKLAKIVEFTNNVSFIEKLEMIKESVKGSVIPKEKVELKESVMNTSSWAHLV